MRRETFAAIIACALLAQQAAAGEKSIKKIHKLILCQISDQGVLPVDYKTGDRIYEAEALKSAKKIDTKKLAKLSYQEISKQFAESGATVVEFDEFYAAYESASKAAIGQVAAEGEAAGKKQDAAAVAGIQSGMAAAAGSNPAMAAAQAAASDGGPKGAAPAAISNDQMAAILNNPNIPEATKALLRKSAASGQPMVTGAAPVMGIPAGMRDGTAASRFNVGQQNGQAVAQLAQQGADMTLSAMKSNQAPTCPSGSREAETGRRKGRAKEWFWQALDKVGADGFAKVTVGFARASSGGGDSYAAQTNAYSHAVRNDEYHNPVLSMDASYFDKNGEQLLEGLKRKAPSTGLLKGKSSAELQRAYEEALPSLVAELTGKLYK